MQEWRFFSERSLLPQSKRDSNRYTKTSYTQLNLFIVEIKCSSITYFQGWGGSVVDVQQFGTEFLSENSGPLR